MWSVSWCWVWRGWTYGGYSYPAWEEESWVAETACEGEDAGGDVGVAGVDCKEANHCSLRGVVDQPILVNPSILGCRLIFLGHTISTLSNP